MILVATEVRCVESGIHLFLQGEIIDDREFQTIFGITRQEMSRYVPVNPKPSLDEVQIYVAVLNNLLGYPHGRLEEVERLVGAPRAVLEQLLDRLRERPAPFIG